jgi:hypothetical protein
MSKIYYVRNFGHRFLNRFLPCGSFNKGFEVKMSSQDGQHAFRYYLVVIGNQHAHGEPTKIPKG